MAGQGSGGNMFAAFCSLFAPGLGQLLQGRLVMAMLQFALAAALWVAAMGWIIWIIHIWSAIDAAWFVPRQRSDRPLPPGFGGGAPR